MGDTYKMSSHEVLWIDDYIWSFSDQMKELEGRGYRVLTEPRIYENLKKKIGTFQRLIVDNKFGDVGLNDGYSLLEHISKFGSETRVVFFSAYIEKRDEEKIMKLDEKKNIAVLYLSKEMPRKSEREKSISEFGDIVTRFFECDFNELITGDFGRKSSPDPIDVHTYVEFCDLDHTMQREALHRLSLSYRSKADEEFNKGAEWILFLGGEESAYLTSMSGGTAPNVEQVRKIAEDHNRIPVLFELGLPVEDVSCRAEKAIGDFESYPRISVMFAGNDSPVVQIHFDTGSDYCFLNEKLINEIGRAELTGEAKTIRISGTDYFCEGLVWPVSVVSESDSGTVKRYRGDLTAYSVVDWESKPLMMHCSIECTRNKDKKNRLCIFRRSGLLGRRLLRDLDVSIVIAPQQPGASFQKGP